MMTPDEIETEFAYRLQERLGVLCGDQNPTKEQFEIALKEAVEAVTKLENDTNKTGLF